MKNYVSIVSSPFQMISLGEYINEKQISNYKIIILYYSELELKQIIKITEFYNLSVFKKVFGTKIIQYLKLYLISKKIKNFQNLIIGNFFSDPHLFFNSCFRNKSLTFIDDGIITNKIPSYLATDRKLIKEKFLKRLAKSVFKIHYPKKINLFTIFKISSTKNLQVESNQFTFLNKKLSFFKQENLLIIIGQPFVEKGLILEDEYIKIIKKIVFKENKYTILYCPHRKESEEKIKLVRSINGIDLINSNSSIEIFLIEKGIYPKKVLGFTSTALITLDKIFNQVDTNVTIKSINLELNSKLFLSLYSEIKKHQIDII